jgi:hypothetical protein
MDDRIGRRAASGGVDQTAVEMAVAIIPQQLPTQGLSTPRIHSAVAPRVCLGTRISMTKPRAHRMRPLARAPMCFAREIQGNMQPARSLARFPSSASSSAV